MFEHRNLFNKQVNGKQPGMQRLMHLTSLSTALLLSTLAIAAPIIVSQGESFEGNIDSRNDPVVINDRATVDGDIESRNAPVTIGDNSRVGDVGSRNGQIMVGQEVQAGDLSARNGSIELGSRSIAGSIETRNGSIRVANSASTGAIESRNGAISIATEVVVDGSLESRNGDVDIDSGTKVAGNVETRNASVSMASGTSIAGNTETRNGNISLDSSEVLQNIKTRYGSIRILGRSEVGGDVTIEIKNHSENSSWMNWGSDFSDAGEILIESGSVVAGNIIVILDEDFDAEPPKVTIQNGARVLGSVQVDSRTDLTVAGEVNGQIERIDV